MISDNLLHLYDFFFPHTPSKIVILPCVQSYSDSLSAFQGTFLWKWILRWLAQAQCLCLCRCSSQGTVYAREKAADRELVVNFYHRAQQKNCRVCVSLVYFFFFLNYIFFYKAKKTRKPLYICEYTCEIMTRPLRRAYVFVFRPRVWHYTVSVQSRLGYTFATSCAANMNILTLFCNSG